MTLFDTLLAFPTVIWTTLLGVVLVYWSLAILGIVDFGSGGPDIDLDIGDPGGGDMPHTHLDGEAGSDVGTLASWLVAFGLGGVPFSVVVSLLTLISWFLCALASLWILPWAADIPRFVIGAGILAGSFAAALPLAAACVRPMRGLFVRTRAISNASLVGRQCRVLTSSVEANFGRALVSSGGEDFHIRVVADSPNTLKRGDSAMIVDYDETARVYRVAPNSEHEGSVTPRPEPD